VPGPGASADIRQRFGGNGLAGRAPERIFLSPGLSAPGRLGGRANRLARRGSGSNVPQSTGRPRLASHGGRGRGRHSAYRREFSPRPVQRHRPPRARCRISCGIRNLGAGGTDLRRLGVRQKALAPASACNSDAAGVVTHASQIEMND